MIASQTGFGRSDVTDGEIRYSVEIRSVNNRFLEISTRLPRMLVPYENEIRQRLRGRMERGKVQLTISEAKESQRERMIRFDSDIVVRIVNGLREVGEKANLKDDLAVSHLIGLWEWLAPSDDDEVGVKRLALAEKGIDAALDEFERIRKLEGENLSNDLMNRLHGIDTKVRLIEKSAESNRVAMLDRIRERIEKYIPAEKIDPTRLEQEVAYMVDRIDITEEVVRMQSHVSLMSKAMQEGGPVGKRLNFLLQEMNREVNTMGSKAASSEITTWVVDVKEELEKMREQVQNIE